MANPFPLTRNGNAPAATSLASRRSTFAKLDLDGDGAITRDEFATAVLAALAEDPADPGVLAFVETVTASLPPPSRHARSVVDFLAASLADLLGGGDTAASSSRRAPPGGDDEDDAASPPPSPPRAPPKRSPDPSLAPEQLLVLWSPTVHIVFMTGGLAAAFAACDEPRTAWGAFETLSRADAYAHNERWALHAFQLGETVAFVYATTAAVALESSLPSATT